MHLFISLPRLKRFCETFSILSILCLGPITLKRELVYRPSSPRRGVCVTYFHQQSFLLIYRNFLSLFINQHILNSCVFIVFLNLLFPPHFQQRKSVSNITEQKIKRNKLLYIRMCSCCTNLTTLERILHNVLHKIPNGIRCSILTF